MDMTDDQLELLSAAYLLSRDGCGMVIADDAYPDADALAEEGWLERRLEPDGEMSWWWTAQADQALALSGVMAAAANRSN